MRLVLCELDGRWVVSAPGGESCSFPTRQEALAEVAQRLRANIGPASLSLCLCFNTAECRIRGGGTACAAEQLALQRSTPKLPSP